MGRPLLNEEANEQDKGSIASSQTKVCVKSVRCFGRIWEGAGCFFMRASNMMDGTVLIPITKSGFGSAPGQIPLKYKVPLLIYDHLKEEDASSKNPKSKYLQAQLKAIATKGTNDSYRCRRSSFVPFDILGRLLPSARDDGVPRAGPNVKTNSKGGLQEAPQYLLLAMADGVIKAHAFLYAVDDSSLQLEYLCAAPRFPGAGRALLTSIRNGKIFPAAFPKRVYLNNNSGRPGFYANQKFTKVGQTPEGKYLMKDPNGKKDNEGKSLLITKYLNVYKDSLRPPSAPKLAPKPAAKPRVVRTRKKPLPPRALLPRYTLRRRKVY